MTISMGDPMLQELAEVYDHRLFLSRDKREAVYALIAAYHSKLQARSEADVAILGKVCSYVSSMTGVPAALIGIPRGKRRRYSNEVSRARFVAMYAMREITGSPSVTGRIFGVHHTTVIHGCRQVMKSLEMVAMARAAIQVANEASDIGDAA